PDPPRAPPLEPLFAPDDTLRFPTRSPPPPPRLALLSLVPALGRLPPRSPALPRLSPIPPRLSPTPPRLSPTPPRLSPTPPRLFPTPPRLFPTPPRSPTPPLSPCCRCRALAWRFAMESPRAVPPNLSAVARLEYGVPPRCCG